MSGDSRSPEKGFEPTTGFLLVRIAEAIDRRFVALLAPLGLRPRHLHVLRYLHVRGPMSQQALANGITVDPGNLIATLDELEAGGLIRREVDPADRRRRELSLTTPGMRKLDQGLTASYQADDEILGGLTRAQRAALHAALLRTYAHLGRSFPGSRRADRRRAAP